MSLYRWSQFGFPAMGDRVFYSISSTFSIGGFSPGFEICNDLHLSFDLSATTHGPKEDKH